MNLGREATPGLALYRHFQQAVVTGWLDKALERRHQATPFLDNVVVLASDPAWVQSLPNAKLPDCRDFKRYASDPVGRVRVWHRAAAESERLADEFAEALEAGPALRVESLCLAARETPMFLQLFDPDSSTYSYLLGDDASREAVLIDPVLPQLGRDLAALRARGLRLVAVLDTHVHADHITGAAALKAATGAPSAVGAYCNAGGYDRALNDGDEVGFGGQRLAVIATPGHTPGSMSFLWQDSSTARIFTGDTLLIGGCGRTDFQGGSSAQLWDSITQKLFAQPGEALVFPGHDYQGRTHSRIDDERRGNPRLAGQTRESFIVLMAALDLPPPLRLDETVPTNKRAGAPLSPGDVVQSA